MNTDRPPQPVAPPETLQDPWIYLSLIREMELSSRAPHLDRWMDLVSKRKPMERDALIDAGKDVWRYRVATVREHLEKHDQHRPSISAATVVVGDRLAEMVYRPAEDPAVGYMVYDFTKPGEPPVWMTNLEHDGQTYFPPRGRILEKGGILFPMTTEEYGTDWDLFMQIYHFIAQYVELDDVAFRTLASIYVLMTWVFDRFSALPYLRAIGDFGSGKTRLLEALGGICFRPVFAGGALTPASIFRIIDKFGCTLLIDEADFGGSEHWDDITKILNMGYSKRFTVFRAERGSDDRFDIEAYKCFGPKLLATRRRFDDGALESRCLSYVMPLLADFRPEVPLVLEAKFDSDAQSLRNKLLWWRFRRWNHVKVDPHWRIAGVEPRVNQIFQPLMACAFDTKLHSSILSTIQKYSETLKADRLNSLEGAVLEALIDCWRFSGYADRVLLKHIVDRLRADHPNLSAERVSALLRGPLGLETQKMGGMAYVLRPAERLRGLASRYGLTLRHPGMPPEASPQGPQ